LRPHRGARCRAGTGGLQEGRDAALRSVVSERMRSAHAIFLVLLILGTATRLGYGVVRYHDALASSEEDFISRWDHDALEHILIAESLIDAAESRAAPVSGVASPH